SNRDWSSDVCSSDLYELLFLFVVQQIPYKNLEAGLTLHYIEQRTCQMIRRDHAKYPTPKNCRPFHPSYYKTHIFRVRGNQVIPNKMTYSNSQDGIYFLYEASHISCPARDRRYNQNIRMPCDSVRSRDSDCRKPLF